MLLFLVLVVFLTYCNQYKNFDKNIYQKDYWYFGIQIQYNLKGGWKTEVFWTKKPTTQEPDVVSSPNFAWWEAF